MGEPLKLEPQPPQEPRSDADDARQALNQIMARHAAQLAEPAAKPPSRAGAVIAILLGLIAAYLWLGQPPFLREPNMAPAPEYQDASLRWAVYLVSERIENYRLTHHALPPGIADAGGGPSCVTYQKLDDSRYRVTGVDGARIVTFDSGSSTSSLLGESLSILHLGKKVTP